MTSNSYFNDLPDEMILEIFSYLDIMDLTVSVQHVNSRWKELSQLDTLWENKTFSPDDQMLDDERVRLLENMPALKSYVATRGRDTKLIIDTLCRSCRDIKHIHLRASHTLDYSLFEEFINTFPQVEKLIIPFLKEENPFKFAERISCLQKLTTLGFTDRYAEVPDGILKTIADGCPSLQHVDLGDSTFKDQDIRYLLVKKQFELLSFNVSCYISRETYNHIIQCKNLEHLHFETFHYSSDVPQQDIRLIKSMVNLKTLELGYLNETQSSVVASIFERSSLPNVVTLSILINDLTGKDLGVVLKNCPNLVHLTVGCRDSDEGLQHIGNCNKLKYLSIGSCSGVTTKTIDYVAVGCPKLRHLNLSCSLEISDDVMLSVIKCRQLRVINISYGGFRGTYFHLIPSNLIHLKEFVIYECGVEDEIWDKLLEEMPHLKLTGRYFEED